DPSNIESYAFSFEKKYISLGGGGSSLGYSAGSKRTKFAKNAIGYAFFNAHFRLFLKTSLRNSLRTPASQHMFSKKFAYDPKYL
ncbi:hypothetical protein HYV57_02710, partial [Candidatus Peregrinibacteria bacterium]|nr:hypothetical protein [Candidatus Peregrinibacteria bacterium]